MSFEAAKQFVRNHKIKSLAEWQAFCKAGKRPPELPAAPNIQYKDQWQGFPDFLGYSSSGRGRKPGALNKPKEENPENVFEQVKDIPINNTIFTYEEAKDWNHRLYYTQDTYRKFVTGAPFHTPGTVHARLPRIPENHYANFDPKEFYYQKKD